MYNKNVITCFFLFGSAPDWYKTQKMCDEAVDDSKITNKILEKFHDSLLANDDIFFFDEVIFYANEMGILGVDLEENNLDDDNKFLKMILKLLVMSDFWLGVINLKNARHFKKDRWRINACSMASKKMMRLVTLKS